MDGLQEACVADACVTDDASGPAQEGKDEPRKSKANVRLQDSSGLFSVPVVA